MEQVSSSEGILANIGTVEAVRLLVPGYNFYQKDPSKAMDTKLGECKATALIICALRPELRFVRSVTKTAPNTRVSAAYIHYLALDIANKTVLHSTGTPLDSAGAHVKGVHTKDYAFGWSKKGESQAQPKQGLTMLDAICEGSKHEQRKSGSYELTMSVKDPATYLKEGTMEDLAALISTSLENMSFEV